MKNSFESQINKLIKYIFDIGYFGTKLHPNRNHEGQYIEGEPFDYMIVLPNYKACFDAKMSKGMRWRFEKKDIKQAENLKHCKNAGMDAFFLVYFSDYKRMVKYDVDLFLSVLAEGRKHLKITEGEEWDCKKCLEVKIHGKENTYCNRRQMCNVRQSCPGRTAGLREVCKKL
jgi:penicillin-binding protein-related factor A (putative recombinase)